MEISSVFHPSTMIRTQRARKGEARGLSTRAYATVFPENRYGSVQLLVHTELCARTVAKKSRS